MLLRRKTPLFHPIVQALFPLRKQEVAKSADWQSSTCVRLRIMVIVVSARRRHRQRPPQRRQLQRLHQPPRQQQRKPHARSNTMVMLATMMATAVRIFATRMALMVFAAVARDDRSAVTSGSIKAFPEHWVFSSAVVDCPRMGRQGEVVVCWQRMGFCGSCGTFLSRNCRGGAVDMLGHVKIIVVLLRAQGGQSDPMYR